MFSRVVFVVSLLPSMLLGNLNRELNNFFDKFGSSANVNSGAIYDGQRAGYATGGGIAVRNRVVNNELAHVDLPRFDAGCGGIDIYAGGFSFLNSDQLVTTLKSIGSSAISYSFMLGLESASPQIANTMKQLQSWSNMINGTNINSCEIGSQIAGGIWPRNTAASQAICRSVGGKEGYFSDYTSSRQKCSQRGEFRNQMSDLADNPEYKDVLLDEYNLTWNAIQKQRFLAHNKELSELFLTMMGTFVVRKGETTEIERWSAMIPNDDFITALMNGGSLEIYRCQDTDKCLRAKKQGVVLSRSSSWSGMVRDRLIEMQKKIVRDEALTQEEIGFIEGSSLPIYRIVSIMTAYKRGTCPVDLENIAEMVAFDMMTQFLREAIYSVREGALQLKNAQVQGGQIEELLEDLASLETRIAHYEHRVSDYIQQEQILLSKMELLESKIFSEVMFD